MIGKRRILIISTCVIIVSLLVFTACDQTSPKKGTSTPQHLNTSTNLIKNPSFEKGKVFNSGLYDKGESPLGKPLGWTTKGQLLNDSTGWVTDEAHTGKRSLKIVNVAGTKAYWQGETIIFKESANALEASIWTKTKDMGKNDKLFIRLDVYLKNSTSDSSTTQQLSNSTRNFDFSTSKQLNDSTKKTIDLKINSSADWQKTSGKTLFLENIEKVVPSLYLKGQGAVWFDDLDIRTTNIDLPKGKVLFDSNNKNSTFNIKPISAEVLGKEGLATHDSPLTTLYQVKAQKTIMSSVFIPIENGALYKLSGDFKVVGKAPSRLYFGYVPYSKDKKNISIYTVNYIKGTDTELVKPCKAEDKIIYVKNADNWKARSIDYIAFDTDDSDNYSDLPNFNLSSRGIEKIVKIDDYYEVTLKNLCGKNYSIGTKVREHADGDAHIYNVARNITLHASTTGFKNLKNLITTNDSPFILPKLYSKTKYIKIMMYVNYHTQKATLQFKNIKITKIR